MKESRFKANIYAASTINKYLHRSFLSLDVLITHLLESKNIFHYNRATIRLCSSLIRDSIIFLVIIISSRLGHDISSWIWLKFSPVLSRERRYPRKIRAVSRGRSGFSRVRSAVVASILCRSVPFHSATDGLGCGRAAQHNRGHTRKRH